MFVAVLAVASFSARATDSIVQLTTPVGSMTFELYDSAKPITVANFLRYIRDGKYTGSFAHRLIQNFVLQGGGYYIDSTNTVQSVVSYGTIMNEAGPFPAYSNVQGTLSMAKLGGDANSASSQWFLNLADNSSNLDAQNGGFTVFAKLLTGSDVLQKILAFTSYTGTDGPDMIADLSNGNPNSPFTDVPLMKVLNSGYVLSDLFYTTWTIISTPAPTLAVTGKTSLVTRHPVQAITGTAAGLLDTITYRVGTRGAWKQAAISGTHWSITARPLSHGRNLLTVIGHGPGGNSTPTKISIKRK
ncbi:MAG TPA: peptidylprolyl isomerase [Chthoniobacterales bacterium]